MPPAVHGISGNYYLDRATGEERMITDAAMLRCGTILAAMAEAGIRTAAVTAKDKLRLMLARGLDGINFSSEKADRATLADNGIDDVEAMVGRSTPISIRRTFRCFPRGIGGSTLPHSGSLASTLRPGSSRFRLQLSPEAFPEALALENPVRWK